MEFQVQSAKYPYSSDKGNRKKFLLKYSQELEPFHLKLRNNKFYIEVNTFEDIVSLSSLNDKGIVISVNYASIIIYDDWFEQGVIKMIQVESKPFLKALRQVINATARVNSGKRKILSYIHVRVYEGTMVVEATNAHILANQTLPARVSQPDQNHNFMISHKFARQLSKKLSGHGSHFDIEPLYDKFNDPDTSWNVIYRDYEHNTYRDKNIEDIKLNYPELVRLIPENKDTANLFKITRKELLPVVKKAKQDIKDMVTSDLDTSFKDIDIVSLKNIKSVIYLEEFYHEKDKPRTSYRLDTSFASWKNGFEITFNLGFLYSLIKNLPADSLLTIRLFDPLRPFTISYSRGEGLICPVRVFDASGNLVRKESNYGSKK